MNRRTFLKRAGGATAFLAVRPAWSAEADPAWMDEELLAKACANIAVRRQSDRTLALRSADGKALSNVPIRLRQVRHEFLFGCNFFRFDRLANPDLEAAYREKFRALLNYATLPFYWASYEPARGVPGYAYSEKAADWCREHGLAVKGHPLVWDHPAGNPRWLPANLEQVGRLSRGRVTEIVSRFKGRIDVWDVVNEAVHLGEANKDQVMSKWALTLGMKEYVAQHLKLARAANPQARLRVNDSRLTPPYYRLLESLRENGRFLYDVVGLQSHMHGGGWPLRRVWDHCESFAKLGLPLHFTETTVVSGPRTGPGERWGATTPALEARQADYVAALYTLLFGHPAVEAITWWDFSDNGAWQGAAAGFLRADMSAKPVYDRLMAVVKGQWLTRAEGKTDERGEFALRAFHGQYQLEADLPGGRALSREISWGRGAGNRIEIAV